MYKYYGIYFFISINVNFFVSSFIIIIIIKSYFLNAYKPFHTGSVIKSHQEILNFPFTKKKKEENRTK